MSHAVQSVCRRQRGWSNERVMTATWFCTDFSERLCEACCRPHKHTRTGHAVKPLSAALEQELLRPNVCAKHDCELAEVYCCDCNAKTSAEYASGVTRVYSARGQKQRSAPSSHDVGITTTVWYSARGILWLPEFNLISANWQLAHLPQNCTTSVHKRENTKSIKDK